MAREYLLPKELLVRTLRLNLVPAARAITPGPATKFPVTFARADRSEAVVRSLKEVRAGGFGEGFFLERLPVERTCRVDVNGYRALGWEGAARAAYCLGFNRASVEVGFGPGGPWVMDVIGLESRAPGLRPPEFLGAKAEYLRAGPATGRPEHRFYTLEFSPDGSVEFPPGAAEDPWTWLSSPVPFAGMPLATRLLFRGIPQPDLVRFLDYTVATLCMLASPVEEARERHATEEGLLGSIRPTTDGFEYLCIPSLLWSPALLRGLLAAIADICSNWADISQGAYPWDLGAEERYLAQRAYYHGDKEYFAPLVARISEILPSLASLARQTPEYEPGDFRPAWGLSVRTQASAFVSIAPAPKLDQALALTAGLGQIEVPAANALARDIIEEGPLPAWAGVPCVSAVELNRVAADALSLPPDLTYRAAGEGALLKVGPVLGIMSPVEEGPRRFGIETDRFREIVKIAATQGILAYVFFPEEGRCALGGGAAATDGWLYREKKGWFRARVPIPDVVYDRHIPDVLPTGAIRDVAREFQDAHPNTVFINSLEMVRACRDKFHAHTLLSKDPYIARYLPTTVIADDAPAVASFALQRKRTYLKLRGGTGSRGLAVIENLGDTFRLHRRQSDGTSAECAPLDRDQLVAEVAEILKPEAGPAWEYIAQDGIDLAGAPGPGEVFEVRIICQKGGAGAWLRTGMVCRFNPVRGRFIVPREELHFRVDELLGQVFPGRVAAIKDELRELARRIPPTIEAGSGRGGEMSVDVGIDSTGRPWLIEVNSKPATLFRDIAAFELRELSLRRIVNYAALLFSRI